MINTNLNAVTAACIVVSLAAARAHAGVLVPGETRDGVNERHEVWPLPDPSAWQGELLAERTQEYEFTGLTTENEQVAHRGTLTSRVHRDRGTGGLAFVYDFDFVQDSPPVVLKDPKAGETTAVVLTADLEGVLGASVGDSGAWLITPTGYADLTSNQMRKPVIGSGGTPMPFWAKWPTAPTLLVATDGLLKYASPDQIRETALIPNLDDAAKALVDLVRLRSGELQDDVGLVLCRPIR